MRKVEVKYGLILVKTEELLGFSTRGNEPGLNVEVTYNLETGYGNVWLVKSKMEAEYARCHDTNWYNADYD